MSQIQRSQPQNNSDSLTVALNVASGFSEPIALAVPRAHLDRPFRQLVRDAIRTELADDPAAQNVDAMLGRRGVIVESGGRYLEPDAQAREVLDASDQDHAQTTLTVQRLLRPQSGGARGIH